MLEIPSSQSLEAIEAALRLAAHRQNASLLAVTRIGQLLRAKEPAPGNDAVVFTVCQPELTAALLAADLRMAAWLPCRIAALQRQGQVTLTAVSPVEFCRHLQRPDLAPLAEPLEAALLQMMEEAARMHATGSRAVHAAHHGGLGATEEQINLRASVPQRIDCRGTKVEEIAGTGQHDSQGG